MTLAEWINALSFGLLLFLVSSGISLTYGLLGIFNFMHGAFYLLGAYGVYSLLPLLQTILAPSTPLAHLNIFIVACLLSALGVLSYAALIERYALRILYVQGGMAQLLMTLGLWYLTLEAVQFIWGRAPLADLTPDYLRRVWQLNGQAIPYYRLFIIASALLLLSLLWALLRFTRIGLIVTAALQAPMAIESLGHPLPTIRQAVFAVGAACAALAGAIASTMSVVEPAMALQVTGLSFVIVLLGGLGSIRGALYASLAVAALIHLGATLDEWRLTTLANALLPNASPWPQWMDISIARLAPALPYLALIIFLAWRPYGLLGRRLD